KHSSWLGGTPGLGGQKAFATTHDVIWRVKPFGEHLRGEDRQDDSQGYIVCTEDGVKKRKITVFFSCQSRDNALFQHGGDYHSSASYQRYENEFENPVNCETVTSQRF